MNTRESLAPEYAAFSTEELLLQYQQSRRDDLKWEIVLRYSGLIKSIALRLYDVYSSFAQLEDIINEGLINLAEAVEHYDPAKGSFTVYASIRMRGVIIDYVKKQDWVASSVRKRVRQIEQTTQELTNSLGRDPTEQEVADSLGLSLAQYRRAVGISFTRSLVSLEELLDKNVEPSEPRVGEGRSASAVGAPEAELQRRELAEVLAQAIRGLEKNEQLVLSLYHEHELKRAEIAEVLGVSPVRVSQIHTRALKKLKEQMSEYLQEN